MRLATFTDSSFPWTNEAAKVTMQSLSTTAVFLLFLAFACRRKPEPHAASVEDRGAPTEGIVDLAAFVRQGPDLQRCSRTVPTSDSASAETGVKAKHVGPLRWSAFATESANWVLVNRDTASITILYQGVGDVEDRGGGYSSYFIKQRIHQDTIQLHATRNSDSTWRLLCPPMHRDYLAIHALDDPGLYIDSAEFTRLLRIGDSLVAEFRSQRKP